MLSPKEAERWIGEVRDSALLGRLQSTIDRLFGKDVGDAPGHAVNSPHEEKRRSDAGLRVVERHKYQALSQARLDIR